MNHEIAIKIVKYGAYYNPAHSHYISMSPQPLIPSQENLQPSAPVVVFCDRCGKRNLDCSIGYNQYDLCLECVIIVNKSLDSIQSIVPIPTVFPSPVLPAPVLPAPVLPASVPLWMMNYPITPTIPAYISPPANHNKISLSNSRLHTNIVGQGLGLGQGLGVGQGLGLGQGLGQGLGTQGLGTQ